VEAGRLEGGLVEDVVRRSLEPLFERAPDIDTILLGCTHYPLLAPVIREVAGEQVGVIDSASATASALTGLMEIHGLQAPAEQTGQHVQLTTGDVDSFTRIADVLFDSYFAQVEPIVVGGAVSAS
jgi:glutamate racemase